MSVANVLTALRTKLLTVNPSPQPAPQAILTDPAEAVTVDAFPLIVLALEPQIEHVWSVQAVGLGRHDYTVALYVFVGSRGRTKLPVLHSRCTPWPKAIADVLIADIKLGGAVNFLGFGGQGPGAYLFKYKLGPIEWADGDYFGLIVSLPVSELVNQTFG